MDPSSRPYPLGRGEGESPTVRKFARTFGWFMAESKSGERLASHHNDHRTRRRALRSRAIRVSFAWSTERAPRRGSNGPATKGAVDRIAWRDPTSVGRLDLSSRSASGCQH